MFRTIAINILLWAFFPAMFACGNVPDPALPDSGPKEQRDEEARENEPQENGDSEEIDTVMPETINIAVSGKTLPLKIEDNQATQALVAALREAPITYEAHDYGGFEKVGALGRTLPSSDRQITTQAGDVILYSSNQIVLFYGSNSWSYTRLGKIQYESLDELKSFLKAGQGNISVTLSL
jgi:hypothetical protein